MKGGRRSSFEFRITDSGKLSRIASKSLNVLTEIPLPDYSAGMVPEFSSLLDKVRQLAELSQSLRRENADLRATMTALTEENARLSSRIREAHDRVAALIDAIPAPSDQEAA